MIEYSQTTQKVAEKIWSLIETFADYGFNKVHSACYGLIAYQTAYLKANYPVAYMAALLTSDYDNTDRLAIEIAECKKMNIEVLRPDINQSFHEFAIVPGESKIRFGLDAIKNVGHGTVDEILRAREEAGGKFADLGDYCKLVSVRIVNRKALESLIKAGAFDELADRSLLINNIDNLLAAANRFQKDASAGQVDLFDDGTAENLSSKISLQAGEPVSLALLLGWERELLGIYLSAHPLAVYKDILNYKAVAITALGPEHDGRVLSVGGSISQVREISTKKGSKMAFVKITDLAGETELIIFPKTYAQNPELWQVDRIILAKGKIDYSRNQELKILVEAARHITEDEATNFDKTTAGTEDNRLDSGSGLLKQRLYIRMEDSHNQPKLHTLKEKLDGYRGETEVVLVTGEKTSKQIIKLPQTIDVSEESLRELALIFGSTNVVVR